MSSLQSLYCANTRTNVSAFDSSTKMTDGLLAVPVLDNTRLIRWGTGSFDVIIDLAKPIILDYVTISYEVWTAAGVYAPSSMIVYGSSSGSTWTGALWSGAQSGNWSPDNGGQTSNNLSVSGNTYQYVKYSVSVSATWCFMSEFSVYGDVPIAPTTASVNYLKGRRNRWDFSGVSAG